MTEPEPTDLEHLDWDSAAFGKMADYATPADEEPLTEPYVPDDTEAD